MDGKHYVVDHTVAEVEAKLDPRQFVWVREIEAWFGRKLLVRLRDANATELQASRDRATELKQRIAALKVLPAVLAIVLVRSETQQPVKLCNKP